MPVYVETLGKRVLQAQVEAVGNVEADQTVDIVAKTPGPILELSLVEGDAVRKGQRLARIDPGQIQANYYRKKSDLAGARYNYYQLLAQKELTEVQASSGLAIAQADLQAAAANVKRAQAGHSATLKLGDTSLAQAEARKVGAEAQVRQAEVDFAKSKTRYERMGELYRQGFTSRADLEDAYQDVLAQQAAVDSQKSNLKVAQAEVLSARSQAERDLAAASAEIETTRLQQVSKSASLSEARAGVSRRESFQQQLSAQRSLVEAAEADLQAAQLQLDDTELFSPVNGFISHRYLDVGSVTSVGTRILTVQSGGEVRIVAPLPQELYARVERGLQCEISVDGNRGRMFAGKVVSKDASIDTGSRQFNIRIQIEDPEGRVKPGMFAKVMLKVGSPDPQLVIPNSALIDKDDETRLATVYKLVDKKVTRVQVRYGLSDATYTRLREGLEEGDVVVIQTGTALKDGQEVAPKPLPVQATPTPTVTPRRSGR